MKIDWNKKYTTIALYACGVSAVVIAAVFLAINIAKVGSWLSAFVTVLNPLITGFIIAYLFNPLMRACENTIFSFRKMKKPRPRLRRVLSLLATYFVYAVIVTLVMSLVIPQVAISYNDFASKMGGYMTSLEGLIKQITAVFPFIDIDRLLDYVGDWVSDSYTLIKGAAPYVAGFFASFVNQLKNAFLGVVLSVYFLFSKEKLTAQLKKTMYAFLPEKRGDALLSFLRFTDYTFGSFIIGKLLNSLIIFIFTFIVLSVFRMPYYQLVSVIIGVTNIIPFFGSFIGAIPSIFIILIADPSKALWFSVIIIIILQLDANIIGPRVIGETTGLSSLGVIVAITLMSGLFGVPGMFFGVPLFALIYIGFERIMERRLQKKSAAASADLGGSDADADKGKGGGADEI